MNEKICNKCGLKKDITNFEFRKDRNSYKGTCKDCRNAARRESYQKNKEQINERRREYYANNIEKSRANRVNNKNKDVFSKLKNQLKRSINHSFERKGFKRTETFEEVLGCNIEEAVNRLLLTYKVHCKKEWDGIEQVEIDHLIPLVTANTREQVLELCKIGNLRLLSKNENHRKGGRVSNGIGRNGRIKYIYCYDFFDDDDE